MECENSSPVHLIGLCLTVPEENLINALPVSESTVLAKSVKASVELTPSAFRYDCTPVQSVHVSSSSGKVRHSASRQDTHILTPRLIQPARFPTSKLQLPILAVRPLANPMKFQSRGYVNGNGSGVPACTTTTTTVQLMPMLTPASVSVGTACAPTMMLNMIMPQALQSMTSHSGGFIVQPSMAMFYSSQSFMTTPMATASSCVSTMGSVSSASLPSIPTVRRDVVWGSRKIGTSDVPFSLLSNGPTAPTFGIQVAPDLHCENRSISSSNLSASCTNQIRAPGNEQITPIFSKTRIDRLPSSARPLVTIAPAVARTHFASNLQVSQSSVPVISSTQRLMLPLRSDCVAEVKTLASWVRARSTISHDSVSLNTDAGGAEKKKRGRPCKVREHHVKHLRIESVKCDKNHNSLLDNPSVAVVVAATVDDVDCDLNHKLSKKGSCVKSERKIIAHVLDGVLIYESNEPFPVERSSIVNMDTRRVVPLKCSMTRRVSSHSHSSERNKLVRPPSGANLCRSSSIRSSSPVQPELGALEINLVGSMKCEFCNEYRPYELFKASRRFCSVSCARKFNVSQKISKNCMQHDYRHAASMDMLVPESEFGYGEVVSTNASPLMHDVPSASMTSSIESSFVPATPDSIHCSSCNYHDRVVKPLVFGHSSSAAAAAANANKVPSRRVDRGSHQRRHFLATWSVAEVHAFVHDTPGCEQYAALFRVHEIDGEALLLLKEEHLMQPPISMKLGPALKLSARIEENRT